MTGKLYLCATPIGNLKDITFRVIETLGDVDLIAAEDTRRTRKLLTHYAIKKPLVSFHDQNEISVLPKLLEKLRAGQSIAQVSDAGTPGIADPGHRLVKACVEEGIPVELLPGPVAFVSAAVLSAFATDDIRFLGYVPRKSGERRRLLERLEDESATTVFYESPRRLLDTLSLVREILGDRPLFIARELTKKFEEHLRGTAEDLIDNLGSRAQIKGEIVLVVSGAPRGSKSSLNEALLDVARGLKGGQSKSEAVKAAAGRHGLPKRQLYEAVHKDGGPEST